MAKQPPVARRLPQSESALPAPPALAPTLEAHVPELTRASAPEPEPEPVLLPALVPVPEPDPKLEPKSKPQSLSAPVPMSEPEPEPDMNSDEELQFEDVPIPAVASSPAAKPQPLAELPSESASSHAEEEIEAALALQALAQGIDSNTATRRWIKAPKSLKTRIKSQPEPALAMPMPPKLKIPNLSDAHEAMLAAHLAEIESQVEPVAKRVRALRRTVHIQNFPTSGVVKIYEGRC